jgi:holo-[acyl-carrier protein] synthase
MILGIGSDILQVSRMRAACERQPRMPARILGAAEMSVYESRKARSPERGLRYLCTRFAAKEAFSKACGLGMHSPMTWRAIEVLNRSSGAPEIVANGSMAQWLTDRDALCHVSMSDEVDHVVAFVVIERRNFSNKGN